MAGIGNRISFRKTQEHVITKEGFEGVEEFSSTPFTSPYLLFTTW